MDGPSICITLRLAMSILAKPGTDTMKLPQPQQNARAKWPWLPCQNCPATRSHADPTRKNDQVLQVHRHAELRRQHRRASYQTFDRLGTSNDITIVNGDRVAAFETELNGSPIRRREISSCKRRAAGVL